jgi:peptide subunit release factor RF-3
MRTLTEEIAWWRTFDHFASRYRQDHLDRETAAIRRGDRRRVRSDWMAVERERGIPVSSAVMSFEDQGLAFNFTR